MRQALFLALGALAVFAVLALPNHPSAFGWGAVMRWPLELPVILFLMMVLGRRLIIVHAVALALLAVAVLKLADYAMFSAFDRPFNPVVDMPLIAAGFSFARDSLGLVVFVFAVSSAILLLALLYVLIVQGFAAWASLGRNAKTGLAAALIGAGCTGWAVADAGHHLSFWKLENSPPGTTRTARLAVNRVAEIQRTTRDLAEFRKAAGLDTYANQSGLLNKLDGRDVLLIWIESYGRSSFDNPLYAPTHLATLQSAQAEIARSGLAMKSGWLTSPTAGGQSWLAHGTLGSGLWTADNGRYQAMIDSGRKWLFHIAQAAGYRTAAVMPAITKDWPESRAMGFELVFNEAQIPYAGESFRWVTMPDQFTLAAYPDLLPSDPRPDFVQIALISSHAPWTPIADVIPWQDVGDGTVFNEMAARGPTPEVMWKDRDAVRDAYRRSVDYVLQVVFSHVLQLSDDAPLVIVAGDHQAAGFVSGSDSKDVAVHMIGPPQVLDHIDHWRWTDGLIPASDIHVRRMDSFRDNFIAAFSDKTSTAMVMQ